MKNKLIKILSIVLVLVVILFIVYKVDSMNQTKENIVDVAKNLIDSISAEDYDGIRRTIRNVDGTELSDQQISNFLMNTGLYRTTLIEEEEPIFTYSANVNFINTDEGSIVFSFKALNGELITNKIEYVNTGVNEYLITNKIKESNKEKERFPIALDLANGKVIGYNDNSSKDKENAKINIYSFVQDEDGNVFVEVIKEAKKDVKVAMVNMMYEELDSLKNINEEYDIKWDKECKEFSVYYDKSVDSKLIATTMEYRMILCATVVQALEGNRDWHLTINYYDYNSEELLKIETIR